jgi:mono/diheme cytochrome c family protein
MKRPRCHEGDKLEHLRGDYIPRWQTSADAPASPGAAFTYLPRKPRARDCDAASTPLVPIRWHEPRNPGGVMRLAAALLIALCAARGGAWAQEGGADDVRAGRRLAVLICANCHVVARDQPYQPILRPPAPSFETIAQSPTVTADSIRAFLTTTHRGLDNPRGMPSPELLDYQIKEVASYLLSLRRSR